MKDSAIVQIALEHIKPLWLAAGPGKLPGLLHVHPTHAFEFPTAPRGRYDSRYPVWENDYGAFSIVRDEAVPLGEVQLKASVTGAVERA